LTLAERAANLVEWMRPTTADTSGVMRMKIGHGLTALALLALTACTPTTTASPAADPNFLEVVPEAVLAAAAPFQDLSAVQLREEDGCYWYRHTGPVETTFLPLLTRQGRPICTRTPGEAVAGA
jgi:hypothetical protein